jgi:glutamyl-tRNA synthetase
MLQFRATRLAPSPTGALHLGHARTFLITWWLARQTGAKLYMRMEDLDAARAKPESVQQAYDDLRWLGMDWDPFQETQHVVVQSQRSPSYDAALQELWRRGAIFPCICTRADIAANVAASASAPHEGDAQPRYPGSCRDRFPPQASFADTLAAVLHATRKSACFRFRVPPGPVTFTDLLAGPHSFDIAAETGDFPITRFAETAPQPALEPQNMDAKQSFGNSNIGPSNLDSSFVIPLSSFSVPPAYQLACVVDDHAMGIDLVLRGDDLLPSTPRQILLYRALACAPPRFAHVPLIVGPDGKRLAKRHGESRIAQFRAAGIPPQRIVGWAAWRSGQITAPREISVADLLPAFDPAKIPAHRITLTPQDLAFLS